MRTLLAILLLSSPFLLISCNTPVDTRPELPVDIATRPSLVTGRVVIVRNLSNEPLANVTFSVSNCPHGHAPKSWIVGFAPGQSREFGILEFDWTFCSGEIVTLSHRNYRSRTIRIP